MITVSQDEYIRMLNLLKYQAGFILSNVKVEEIKPDKKNHYLYLILCIKYNQLSYIAKPIDKNQRFSNEQQSCLQNSLNSYTLCN